MLLNFRVANHRSIRDELEWQLHPVYDGDRPTGTSWQAVPVAGIFGSNAAGKSNVVDALQYMADMVSRSHLRAEAGEGVRRRPFLLDAVAPSECSWYVVDLVVRGVRYAYGFEVDDESVRSEWLYTYPEGRKRVVFERDGETFHVGSSQRTAKALTTVAEVTAPNALFLSMAARSKTSVASLSYVYNWFRDELVFGGPVLGYGFQYPPRVFTWAMASHLGRMGKPAHLRELLRAADLGIEDFRVEVVEEHFYDDVRPRLKNQPPSDEKEPDALFEMPIHTHRVRHELWLRHTGRNGSFELPLSAESSGTKVIVEYAVALEQVTDQGGTLVVDELDSSLHPRLSAFLVGLFQDPERNPHGAQLLFTSHDVSLLGRKAGEDILKRDQIWFASKNEFGETSLYPLSDFRPRSEENRERRYLSGSYGAVPMIDDTFALAIAGRGGTGDETAEAGRQEGTEA
ncbi:ATP-binding protein [Streptomyces sp. NTH33]|uniref:AAA family ATPase n=1 Tax=Streptomyces sp. NTH33 TaxID=1735453 RepID=UPI000DAA783B|nr:ATP-binding protein [Streptomyces sp. NTH33]PZH17850.1 ATP-binding protein [Streptomyces sp. NTH33]